MRLLVFLLFLLMLPSAMAINLPQGTVINPSGINLSMILGMNHSFDEPVVVESDGWYLNPLNWTLEVPVSNYTNFTSYNQTSTEVNIDVTGDYTTLNFTIVGLPSSSVVEYADNLVEWNTDGDFDVDLLGGSNLLTITSNSFLHLSFESQVEGVVVDELKSRTFNDTEINFELNELEIGYVKVMFNVDQDNGSGYAQNWSQYYEFDNDNSTELNSNISIITNPNTLMYFQVLDYGNAPIKDAIVRAYNVYQDAAWTNYTLVGRRLTNDEGYTFFLFDSDSQILLTAMKDGFELKSFLISPADEVRNTEDLAWAINLNYNQSATDRGVAFNIPAYYEETDSTIRMSFYAPDKTTMRGRLYQSPASAWVEAQLDSYARFIMTFHNGTHYTVGTGTNITVEIQADETFVINRTVSSRLGVGNFTVLDVNVLTDLTLRDDFKPLLFLAIVLIPALIGIMMQNSQIAFNMFMMLGALVSIANPSFLFLSITCIAYYILRYLKGLISE